MLKVGNAEKWDYEVNKTNNDQYNNNCWHFRIVDNKRKSSSTESFEIWRPRRHRLTIEGKPYPFLWSFDCRRDDNYLRHTPRIGKKFSIVLKIKEQKNTTNNLDTLINNSKPSIFWKEKPLVKKQLSIWSLDELKKIISEINKTELLCKKNPQISEFIFFKLFSKVCLEANSSS